MAKRISKKLLMGLGSAITFGAVGTISGFGLKSIIDSVNEQNLLNNQINKLAEADFATAPDYNKATREMFFDTTDLKSFHFGNVQKGQTITPYGWLGVFEQPNSISRKIALTGWNGEILWVNDDYANQGSNLESNVYDMKYDFNTDLIFVARTSSKNGLINDNKSVARITIDVLDAKSGIKKQSVTFNQTAAWNVLSGAYIDSNDSNHLERSRNLYSLDVISNGTNAVVLSWTPNFLQLTSRRDNYNGPWDNTKNRIMPMYNLISNNAYSAVVTNLNFIKNTTNGTVSSSNVPRLNIRDATSIQNTLQPGWFVDSEWEYLHNFSLITNPFITTNAGKLMVHLLVANKHDATSQSKVYHQAVEFEPNGKYIKEVTENITSKIPIFKDTTWIVSKDWSSNFINANLKINRNMFDNNSIVFAFPYAAGGNPRVPIFNVAQLLINPSDGKIDWSANKGAKKSMVLPAGKEIVDYWLKNKGFYGTNNNLNKIYPFPGVDNNQNNLNHNYNRLITVSPFDNTIIYAAKPNLTNSIFDVTNNYQDKWAGFWLGTVSKSTPYRPFLVYNDSNSLGGVIDPKMTSINDLYTYGPTFDLRSLTGQSLNLYFNQTGTGRNDRYSNSVFLSSKIGLLTDVLSRDRNGNIWFTNVTNPTSKPLDQMGSNINDTSYSTLIYSRANLEKWYPKTWLNNETPGNLFSYNQQLNANSSDNSRAVARKFDSTLSESNLFNSNRSVDLLSDWYDKNNKAPANYGRLLVKRPEIRVRNESIANVLPVEVVYPFNFSDFLNSNIWIKSLNNNERLKFKFSQNLPTASYQIFSSWKNQMRMNRIGSDTKNLNASEVHTLPGKPQPTWYDKRQQNASPNPFGNVNNDVQVNGKYPLRMLLRIAKPSGNLPSWFNGLEQQKLFDKYPLAKDAVTGETTFEDVLKKFVEEKTKAIDVGQEANNVAVGLANLKIEAFADLNPLLIGINNKTIYKNGTKRIIILNDQGQRIIYEDKYDERWREVYDQSATVYDEFNLYGFGSRVRSDVQTSWTNQMPSENTKFKVVVNANLLKDNLVRKSASEQQLFTFDYETGNQNLVITPKDASWLRPRLLNFQRLINMQARFEYQTATNGTWQTLTTTTDKKMQEYWPSGNTFKLPTSNVTGITKLRIKLIPMNINSDNNSFVQFENYNEANPDNKFISIPQESGVQRVDVDKNWFNEITLTSSNFLQEIDAASFEQYQNTILEKSKAIKANPQLKSQIKLVYQWPGETTWVDHNSIINTIKGKLNFNPGNWTTTDQGVWSLFNGSNSTNNPVKIKVKFEKVNSNSNIQFVNSTNASNNDLTGELRSTVKTKVDLSSWLDELRNLKLQSEGNNSGVLTRFVIPGKSGTAGQSQFSGKTYEQIIQILQNVGVSIRFKKWQGSAWSNWLTNSTEVNSYNVNNPEIIIGFTTTNSNIELKDTNSTTISDNTEIKLKLSLPKIVKLPANEQTMIVEYNKNNPFSGNTFNLGVDTTKLNQAQQAVLTALKQSSQGNNGSDYSGLDAVLEFKYKLGNSTFLSATELQKYLKTQTSTDQTSNALLLKVNIKTVQGQEPEFALDQALADKEFQLQTDNNTSIKKWLHGKSFEAELAKNNISVTGSKSNLVYSLSGELAKFTKANNGKYSQQQLTLQYQLIGPNDQPVGTWTDGYMPETVASNINKIKVRIVWDQAVTTANQIYIYGPQDSSTPNQNESTIDLSRIATLVKIDPAWFNNTLIVNTRTDSKSLTIQNIKDWENQIYQNIAEATDPAIRSKIIIKYQFGKHLNLTSDNLLNAINNIELNNYTDSEHHGIIKLYDKNTPNQNGYKIKATFEKVTPNDPTIQFVNKTGTPIDGDNNKNLRTGDVNTTNITTTLDLTAWITNLINQPTVIETQSAGTINTGGLKPPSLATNALLGNNAKFNDLKQWLAAANINLLWSKTSDGSSGWQSSDTINEYDPTKKKLWFAIENQASNLILKLGNNHQDLTPQTNNKNNPFEIKLDAPALINIHPNQLAVIAQHISGNTKQLNVNVAEITKQLQQFKKSLGTGFEDAPLTINLKVGDQGPYDYKNIAQKLLEWPDDVANGIVVANFAIDTTQANASKFELTDSSKADQQIINDNGTIKVYINDKNILKDLKATTPQGSSKNLKLSWQNGISIDPQSGVLIAADRGRGLRIEYTFRTDLQGADNDVTNTDPTQGWSKILPTSFRSGVDKSLFIRIRLVEPTKYVYDNLNQKITIDLTKLKSIISLDTRWLQKTVVANPTDASGFGLTQITNYENSVFDATQIPDTLKKQIMIKYDFNGQTNVDKTKLNELITSYKTNNSSKQSLGILQFANGTETANDGSLSEKIIAKFTLKTDPNPQYELEFTNGDNQYQLDTSKVITTIDFNNVLRWLQSIKVPFENNRINIPNINTQDAYFNGQTWVKTEQALKGFGITIEYRSVLDLNQNPEANWSEQITSVNQYNPQIGKFQIRFKFDAKKSKNTKFKVNNTDYNGATANLKTPAFDINLNVKLNVQINGAFVDAFRTTPNVVSGNTKYLSILERAEAKMLESIKNENILNNQAFNDLDLTVEYQIGEAQAGGTWRKRTEFIDFLKKTNTDQVTNKIVFRFAINPQQQGQFSVNQNNFYTLSEKQLVNVTNLAIKYFVHTDQRENKANNVNVSGSQDQLQWDFSTFGQANTNFQELNGEVFLRSAAGGLLRLEFTTKTNPSYSDRAASNDVNNLKTQWVTKKPLQIATDDQQKLFIRIKPINNNIVYEADYRDPTNNVSPGQQADVHKVQTRIQTKINIDKNWLNEITLTEQNQEIEIKQFNEELINKWIEKLRNKIKVANNLADDTYVSKIKIEFTFDGSQTKLNATGLVNAISTKLNDYNSAELGIFHLWNPNTNDGIKINATFTTDDRNIILVPANNAGLSDTLNTSKIYTLIDFNKYATLLETKPTSVVPTQNGQPGDISSFEPPAMDGTAGSGFLAGKNYDEIAARLKVEGIDIQFSKSSNGPWSNKDQINSYNPKDPKLFLSFSNRANNNVHLNAKNITVTPGQSNQAIITLTLKAPKLITIDQAAVDKFRQNSGIRGNTKNLEYNQTNIDTLINEIKRAASNNAIVGIDKAPLKVLFKLGDSDFLEINQLVDWLKKQPTDQSNNALILKFSIPDDQAENWIISPANGTYTVYSANNTDIPIFVNDQGIFNAIKDQTTITGTNNNLNWNFPTGEGFTIDNNDNFANNSTKGKGLKLEFTTNGNLDINASGWTRRITNVPLGTKAIYIKIIAQNNQYIYQKTAETNNAKIQINLDQIREQINVDSSWLMKDFINTLTDIKSVNVANFQTYEQKVINEIPGLPNVTKTKLAIKYYFNGSKDPVDKNQLVNLIQNYQNQQSFNILQLSNGTNGLPIVATFVKADENGLYDLIYANTDPQKRNLDTSKVTTTIEFDKAISWLTNPATKIEIENVNKPGKPNAIKILLKTISANGDQVFNNKDWSTTEQVLKSFGIITEYRALLKSNQNQPNQGWTTNLTDVDEYDPGIGKFQIRFKFDNAKASNMKLKLTSGLTVNGTDTNPTQPFDVQLKIKLMVEINPDFVLNGFISKPNVISGNTKVLAIDSTLENQMVQNIKNANMINNNAFKDLKLEVRYQLGEARIGDVWRTRQEFIDFLNDATDDQITNKVVFKFTISADQNQEFGVVDTIYTLSDFKSATDPNLKIKYFINSSNWEDKASKLKITGTSDNLQWNFVDVFGANKFEESNGKVYVKTNAGLGLQLYFTTNDNATYENPGTSDQANEIGSKWVSIKPNAINAGVTNLKVKLVANQGYIYGPSLANATPKAQAHNVTISIQKVLYVDRNWFTLNPIVNTQIDISSLNYQKHLKPWEDEVYKQLAKKNSVNDQIARKIKIKYFFEDQPNEKFEANDLITKINQLRTDYNNADLGILQLWNGQKGRKLNAIFESGEPANYAIRVENVAGEPAIDLIKNQLNTENIFTTISLVKYIKTLMQEKTTVIIDDPNRPGSIQSFNPPDGANVNEIFYQKSYDQIAARLQATGVKIEFAKNKTGPWLAKEKVKDYDIQLNSLYLRLTVESSNIKLQLNSNTQIGNNQNSERVEIRLPLEVPKYIVIDSTKNYWKLTKEFNFRENTKNIEFDIEKINKFLEDIKNQNAIDGVDESYKQAPLTIQFQVGTGSEFKDISELKEYLKNHNDDMPDRQIKFQFALTKGADPKLWKIKDPGEYTLLTDADPANKVLIFVNDKNVFNELKQMTITGSNDNLEWNWPNLVQPPVLDETTGILTPTVDKNFGKGLRFEFTFNSNYAGAQVGTNQETDWVSNVPKSYDANKGFTKVFLRIKVTDPNRYVYTNENSVIELSLAQVGQKITLKAAWLEDQFNKGKDLNLENLTADKIKEYEDAVKQRAKDEGIDQSLLDKFTIKYQFNFNGNLDDTKLITKEELIQKINDYKTNNSQPSLGILQLWNNNLGIKIAAKFVDAIDNDKFTISILDQPEYRVINTENILTTIDFIKVINWLINTRKLVNVTGTNTTASFSIPPVNAAGDQIFNAKEWDVVTKALKSFGITTQYRKMLVANLPNNNNDWVDNLSQVKEYDETIGKIQIRFKFDNDQAKNIRFKTAENRTYNGKTETATDPFELSLNIKLTLQIKEIIVKQKFLDKSDVISGNTKFLDIKKTYQDEMLQELIKDNVANNAAFADSQLVVKYKLANQNNWLELNQFIETLKTARVDQTSNKVLFKFEVKNPDFKVDEKDWVLFEPNNQTDQNQWKVKFFINNSNWESNAQNVVVTGKTSALIWKWNGLGVNENNDGTVSARGLDIQFSAKENADYNDADVSNVISDLKTKWITIKPQILDPTIQNLWIRIKAKAGYVYGPAYNQNGVTPVAKAHKVNLEIKREILVDPKALLTNLTIENKPTAFVTDITTEVLNKFVDEALNQINEQSLKNHVTVKFNFNNKKGLTADGLYKEIKAIIESNNNPNYGVLQLWNNVIGEKIDAYYDLVNPQGDYILITKNNSNPNEPQTIITGHIKTKIDLIEIVNYLKTQKIEFEPIDNKNTRNLIDIKKWKMPQTKPGSDSLNNISWETFENRLKRVGVSIKARIVNSPDQPQAGDWKPLEQITQYNENTLQLAFRFQLDNKQADNIVLSVLTDSDTDSTNLESPEFKMNIKAPARVNVDNADLETFKTTYQIGGNTKNIKLDQNAENVLIDAIYNKNIAINSDVFQDLKSRLSIEYYLGKKPDDANSNWFKYQEFIDSLNRETKDQTTNEIWFRLSVNNPSGENIQSFNIDSTPKKLNEEKIDASARVKIFINDNGLENRAKNLKAIGSTENVTIKDLDTFKKSIPNGLIAQWANVADPKDTDWKEQPPTTLNADKNFWIRFKSNDGYEYEKAIKNPQDEFTQYSEKHPINTEGLKVILKVKKEWLEKIQITNNTSNPQINEDQTMVEINKILPTDKSDLIELQYHIKGTSEWLKKDQFMQKLKDLKGAKDNNNFILKREEIEVRYQIKKGEDDYSLNIDNDNVDQSNEAKYYVQLVDDTKQLNTGFEGYINIDLLEEFKQENFKIQGSTTKPQFIVSNRQKLESYFAPYASDGLFDIIYSTKYNSTTSQWEWDENKSILNGAQLIGQDGLINQKVEIGADKKFALKFISKKTDKYKVYKNQNVENDGYILDLSNNVKITIEIDNPFTKNNKTLGLWTRDGKNAKYYQSEGGFKIVVADKNNFEVDDKDNPKSAQKFLAETTSIQQNEKDALEFVYHIFKSSPSKDEIDRIQRTINDYNSDDWKEFKSQAKADDWSPDLGLKVNDYVAVAIRVKQKFSTGENAFVLKGNDNSMILPVMIDSTGKEKRPGRISGYKVRTSEIGVDETSVSLISMVDPELPPLDGWTLLSKLNLKQDEKSNYLGVDLDLQLYSDYYKKDDGKIWISGSGAKLIKRETIEDNPALTDSNKVYKDGQGKPIKDEKGNEIKIYKTDKNRLSNPKKSTNPTKNQLLENLGNGGFRLNVDKLDNQQKGFLSLFRNQDIDLKLKPYQGQGTVDWPDFYLDENDKIIELKTIISPKIKYPVENENKITYLWNYDDFSSEKIEYEKVGSNSKPENGAAKIKTILKLLRKEGDAEKWEEISGNTPEEAIANINQKLEKDFSDQLKFQLSRTSSNGGGTEQEGNNIYQFQDLKNKDRIVLKMVAKADDLYYVEAPRPLIINVNGLTEAAPDKDKLQHLRVEQGGLIDGHGSFKVLVSNPKNPNEDERVILKGWKFMVRVWAKDFDEEGRRTIKTNWTDDQASINNLENGDKVEWKLVSENGNPVKDAYYNTIALEHKQNPDGKIEYNFGEVNYPKGEGTYNVVNKGIGAYPEVDQYPEKSGFVISGLKDKFEIFKIDKSAFEKVLAQLQPTYVGINTQGTIRFDSKYFEQEYWVNTKGDIYTQAEKPQLFKDNLDQEIIEIKLIDFLKQVTFYTHDPVIANYQGGFKFSGNDININNHLTNGDQMWATFDTRSINDVNNNINNNDPLSSLTTRLNDVSGLKDIIDPMSPLWYVLMALAGIATLGTAALIAFLIARHKKLKGKN